jgi:hypothetical protein
MATNQQQSGKEKKPASPVRQGITAGVIVLLIAVFAIAIAMLAGPAVNSNAATMDPEQLKAISNMASILQVIQNGSCPAAIVVGLIVYFVAKGKQKD